MANIKLYYGASVSMTVTNLANLANHATNGWKSDAIDNSANLNLDYIFTVQCDMANTAPANEKAITIYAYATTDGTIYTDGISAGEATYTMKTNPNLVFLDKIIYNTADEVVTSSPISIAKKFGIVPIKFGLVLINYTGAALAASGHSVKYIPVYKTIA